MPRMRLVSVGYAITADNLGGGAVNVSSSGNVGIGTTSPSAQLHVKATGAGAIGILQLQGNDANTMLTLHDGGSVWKIGSVYSAGDGSLYISEDPFGNSNITTGVKMVIQQSGNVGIGTTGPTEDLHVFAQDKPIQQQTP